MKKIFLTLAIGALALSACTSTKEEGYNAITFQNVVGKNSRALDGNNFGLFQVYGYYTKGNDLNTRFNIYTDTPVMKTGNEWSTSISRYWVPDAVYSFYAFSCENSDIDPQYGGPSVDKNDGTFRINYTNHATNGKSHDLVFASATDILGKLSGNAPVSLEFKHILSKVDMKFESEFPEGYEVEVSNITIMNFQNTGTFTAYKKTVADGSVGSWSNVDYDAKQPNSFKLNTVGASTTTVGGTPVMSTECYMIPHDYDPINSTDNPVKIQFSIKVTNPNLPSGQQVILSNVLAGTWHPTWRPGVYYTYIVRLSGSEAGLETIKFGVKMDDWNQPGDDNKPDVIHINIDYNLSEV